MAARLAPVLERLPEIVAQAIDDLYTLLASHDTVRGREVMRALLSEIGSTRYVEWSAAAGG